jgi:hypothetical protein
MGMSYELYEQDRFPFVKIRTDSWVKIFLLSF